MRKHNRQSQDVLDEMDLDGAQVKIDQFCKDRWQALFQRCGDSDQRKACWYLSTRYLLGLRSLRYLYAADDIAGCFTLARCCHEYEVSLLAIAKHGELGSLYMNYDVHARNRHLNETRDNMSETEIQNLEAYMSARFGSDFASKKQPSWCNFRKLCEKSGRKGDYATYIAQCQIAHGTITGMRLIDGFALASPPSSQGVPRMLTQIHTLAFLPITDTTKRDTSSVGTYQTKTH